MAGATRNLLLYMLLGVVIVVLIAEIAFLASGCYWALKVTGSRYWLIPIMLFLLAVAWAPLLLHKYHRRTFVFGVLVMTTAFAVAGAVMSMLMVTDAKWLKLPAIVAISWIAGGLWGWTIVYLDKHKWRIGERLGMLLHGHQRMNDHRSRRPMITVILVSMLAILTCSGLWVVGREKLWGEIWRESGYRKKLWVAWNFVEYGWLIGNQEKQVFAVFGDPKRSIDGANAGEKMLWWSIGTAPPGATSYNAGQHAYLCVTITNGIAKYASIEYLDEAAKPADEKGDGNAH
jgi:hypothetical protein